MESDELLRGVPSRSSEWGPRALATCLVLAAPFALLGAAVGGQLSRQHGQLTGAAIGLSLCLFWILSKAYQDLLDLSAEQKARKLSHQAGEARRRDEVESYQKRLREAIEGLHRRAGSSNPLALALTRRLAASFRDQREFARAATLLSQVVPAYERDLGPDHPTLATVLHDLASCHAAQKDSQRGLPAARRAANIRIQRFGASSPEAAESQSLVAALLLLEGQGQEALELASGAQEAGPGALETLADAKLALGQGEEAAALYEQVLEYSSTLDPVHVAQLRLRHGQALAGQGKLAEAEDEYAEMLRLIQTEIGEERGVLTAALPALSQLLNWAESAGAEVPESIRAIRLMEICLQRDRNRLRQFHALHPDLARWQDLSGWTGLQWAAFTGDPELVRLMLDLGASWRAGHGRTMTAMDVAVSYNHYYVMKKLLEAGADFNLPGVDGMTPIHWAARRNHELTIEKLIGAGVDYNRKDAKGRTALHIAAMLGHLDTAIALIQQGVPLNVADQNGQTPLHMAAGKGNVKLLIALLDGGADPSLKEKSQSLTPLELAQRLGHREAVTVLKARR